LAVVARKWDNVVRVPDLESGIAQLTIKACTDSEVCGLKVSRDAVAVVGDGPRVVG